MQNMKEAGLIESEAATSKGSPDTSSPVPPGKDPEFERKADRWAQEVIANLNRNALKGTPTS